jgi:hypothetical protein
MLRVLGNGVLLERQPENLTLYIDELYNLYQVRL